MRKIKPYEITLIRTLTNGLLEVPEVVRDMDDGGMGSITFDIEGNQRRNEQVAKAEYIDDDGVLVDIELSSDENGNLFELDFWKVDFSPLKVYPSIEKIEIKAPNTR
jgi:hypothetical protein